MATGTKKTSVELPPGCLFDDLKPLEVKSVRKEAIAAHIDRYTVKTRHGGVRVIDHHNGNDPDMAAYRDFRKMEKLQKRGKTKPLPVSLKKPVYLGDVRKPNEGVKAFCKRVAREYGVSPLELFASRHIMRDAGFSKKEYSHEDAKAWAKEFWPLAQEWAKEHNDAYYAGRIAGFTEMTEKRWFHDPTAAKEVLTKDEEFKRKVLAMSSETAETAEAKTPRKGTKPAGPKNGSGPAEKDGWGFRVGSRAAKINAALTAEPQTPAAIEKRSGATSVHSHLAELCKRKLAKKLSDGTFRLRKGVQSP